MVIRGTALGGTAARVGAAQRLHAHAAGHGAVRSLDRRVAGTGIGGAAALRSWRGARQHGYTLIEVLVAFAVLALALTLLLGTLSGATRQVRWSADAGRAALHAQSLLAGVGVGEVLQPGRRDGALENGRYRWVLEVEPYVDPALPPPVLTDPFAPQMLALHLTVAWGDEAGERLELRSLRLVQPGGDSGVDL